MIIAMDLRKVWLLLMMMMVHCFLTPLSRCRSMSRIGRHRKRPFTLPYRCDYNLKDELTCGKIGEWKFDKRSHLRGPPPRNLPLALPGVPESVETLVKMVNEASANLPRDEEIVPQLHGLSAFNSY